MRIEVIMMKIGTAITTIIAQQKIIPSF